MGRDCNVPDLTGQRSNRKVRAQTPLAHVMRHEHHVVMTKLAFWIGGATPTFLQILRVRLFAVVDIVEKRSKWIEGATFPALHKKRSRLASSSPLKVAVEVSASLDSRVTVTTQPYGRLPIVWAARWLEKYQLCCRNLMESASLIQVSKNEREGVFHLDTGHASYLGSS